MQRMLGIISVSVILSQTAWSETVTNQLEASSPEAMPAVQVPYSAAGAAFAGGSFMERYVTDRLEVGLRISRFSFTDPERYTPGVGGYAPGISTYSLEEQQSGSVMPYVRYHFTDIVSLQLGWENLEGRTKTLNVTTLAPYPHSNGNVELSGPSVTVLGRYPLPQLESVTPYAGLGLVLFSGNFAMDPDWHENGRRYMESDDETGILATLGASVRIYEQFEADLSLSYIRARPSARYRLWIDDGYRATWEFPMDSWVYQLGIKYAF